MSPLSIIKRLESIRIGQIERAVSIGFPVICVLFFTWFYEVGRGFGGRASQFPSIVFQIGIATGVLLLVTQTLIARFFPQFLLGGSDITEYLKGGESRFSYGERMIRFVVFISSVIVFFIIARWNMVFAIAVVYPGTVYLLGVRDIKTIVAATITLVGFVYVVFVVALDIPLEVF